MKPPRTSTLLTGPLEKIRVITVSPYEFVRSALRHILALQPEINIIAEAQTLDQAQEQIRHLRPGVVIVENVEASLGIEHFVAAAEHLEHAHVVLLGGSSQPHMLRALLRAGLTAYVSKKSPDADLVVAVRSASCGKKFFDPSVVDAIAHEEPNRKLMSSKRRLSFREMQVLRRLVRGHTSGEIAPELGISVKTVETYRSRIYKKLKVDSRAALMKYAAAAGIISLDLPDGVPEGDDQHSNSER